MLSARHSQFIGTFFTCKLEWLMSPCRETVKDKFGHDAAVAISIIIVVGARNRHMDISYFIQL